MKSKPTAPKSPKRPWFGVFFTGLILAIGLLLGTRGTLELTRSDSGAVTAVQSWEFAGTIPLVRRTVENVTDARMVERSVSMADQRSTLHRDGDGAFRERPESLAITGDAAVGWSYQEDLPLIRRFISNSNAHAASFFHPVDIRRQVSSWLCLGLFGSILLAGLGQRLRKPAGMAPEASDRPAFRLNPLPEKVAHALILSAAIVIGVFFWKGHELLGPLAKSKVRALQQSATAGDAVAVEAALKRGVWPDARDDQGATALHLAAASGSAPAVETLLRAGASLGPTDLSVRTPLAVAIERRHPEIALLLIEAGSDGNATDANGRTPLHLAAELGYDVVVGRLLATGSDPNLPDIQGRTPLFQAAGGGHAGVVEQLVEAGAQPGHRDQNGTTPADLAASRPDLKAWLSR